MERPRHDDPAWAGPHRILARLEREPDHAVAERRFIARSADGDRTLLVRLPVPGADPARWAVEAEGARRLATPGFLPVEEVGGTEDLPWCATPYIPAVSLPAALRAHGGPLPDPTVRALATALAGTLAMAHTRGVTHAGLSPASVLLTTEGPRLSCFGAARAAAPDGELRSDLPGLDPGSLAPEQAAGGRPRPLGDVYALGAVLAHASTGHTAPESRELPEFLRVVIPACLSRDPARRPQAHEVLALLDPDVPGQAAAHPPTAPDTASPLPLPAAVVAALARQSAQVLAAELPSPPAALD